MAVSAHGPLVETELAVTVFQLGAGVAGGAAALVAARRLSQLDRDGISISELVIPVLVAGGSTVVAAFLLPNQ